MFSTPVQCKYTICAIRKRKKISVQLREKPSIMESCLPNHSPYHDWYVLWSNISESLWGLFSGTGSSTSSEISENREISGIEYEYKINYFKKRNPEIRDPVTCRNGLLSLYVVDIEWKSNFCEHLLILFQDKLYDVRF